MQDILFQANYYRDPEKLNHTVCARRPARTPRAATTPPSAQPARAAGREQRLRALATRRFAHAAAVAQT